MNGKRIVTIMVGVLMRRGCVIKFDSKKFSPPRRPKNNFRKHGNDFGKVE
jgi:hypothetical protein